MADVKWIKIMSDIFDDEKILLIESLPDADSVIVIWFKLLCLAGKQNNSGVFMVNDRIPYTDTMLSVIFRRKESIVQLALQTFKKFGMIEIVDGTITISNWGKHQNFDKIEAKNKYMKNYMQEYRQKQKQIAGKSNCKTNSKVNSKVNVSEAEEDIYKEDIYKEELDKQEIYKNIVEYLNSKANTHYRITDKTKALITARINQGFNEQDFIVVIDKKCTEWIGSEMEKYLRPETLFGNKFESYLNQKITKKKSTMESLQKLYEEAENE